MDRLTTRNKDGKIGIGHPLRYYNYQDIRDVLVRLAAYEDAEEQGRLKVLPCTVGDTVYEHDGVRIYESVITSIILTGSQILFHTEGIGFDETAIGRSIFLTREEAERALEGETDGKG